MSDGYLEGQLLIAMPSMGDPRFAKSVIFMCAHSADGAMGLIINQLADNISFSELLEQMDVGHADTCPDLPVHIGGPVETGRGFVLHTRDYQQDSTMAIGEYYGLTATIDILQTIAGEKGPSLSLLALGYAGWGAGQLDREIQANGWLSVDADLELVFDDRPDDKWERAVRKVGVDPSFLSMDAGRA